MKYTRFILGAATGLGVGYAAWRTFETAMSLRAERTKVDAADPARYGRMHRRLAVGGVARSLAGAAAVAYGPSGAALDRMTQRLPIILRPGAFALGLGLIDAVADLPIAFVEDHTIEQRYGLTEQTGRDWLADYSKGAVLGASVTSVMAMLFGAVVRRMPKHWPIAASLGTFPLLLLANVIVPIFVMPLFNRFEPLDGPLEVRLRKLAARYGVGNADILRMDMSKQTTKANAFVAGVGSTHRIVLGDTLIDCFKDDEIEFVVAHELGHYVARDTWRMIGISQALATILFCAAHASISRSDRDRLRDRPILLARIFATMTVGTQLLRPLLLAFSRSREWAADHFAVAALNDPSAGAAAFRRLRDQNMAEDEVPGWYEFFFSSHPSLGARIAALHTAAEPTR